MRKIISILSVALVAIIFAACSSNSPAGVVERYSKCMQDGKYMEAVELFHFKKELDEDQKKYLAAIVERAGEQYKEKGGIASVKVDKVEMDESGESAKVSYTTTFGNGTAKTDTDKVVKIDGKWLLDSGK